MKVLADKMKLMNGGPSMPTEHSHPSRHIPPHERRSLMQVEFTESDWEVLRKVFIDEDTASAAADIIRDAPPEIQILAVQLVNIIEEVA